MDNYIMLADFTYQRNTKVYPVAFSSLTQAKQMLYSYVRSLSSAWLQHNTLDPNATNCYGCLCYNGTIIALYLNVALRSGVVTYTEKWTNGLNFFSN